MKTTEDARQYFKDKGLTYSKITYEDLTKLQLLLIDELNSYINSDEYGKQMGMKLRTPLKKDIKVLVKTGLQHAFLKVDGSYFGKREAISFNRDGFIGFAGWASSVNVQPMINAFIRWCDEITKEDN